MVEHYFLSYLRNVKTQKGCILSFNVSLTTQFQIVHAWCSCFLIRISHVPLLKVIVGPDINLRPGLKITLKRNEKEDDFGLDELSLEEKDGQGVRS